jgi:hypothetical protein
MKTDKIWTVDSRLAYLGYDFHPLRRVMIGMQAAIYFLEDHLEYPAKKAAGMNAYTGADVKYLDLAIADAIKKEHERDYRKAEVEKFLEHYGKYPGKRAARA